MFRERQHTIYTLNLFSKLSQLKHDLKKKEIEYDLIYSEDRDSQPDEIILLNKIENIKNDIKHVDRVYRWGFFEPNSIIYIF